MVTRTMGSRVKVDVASHVGNRLEDNGSNCRMFQAKLNNCPYFIYVDTPLYGCRQNRAHSGLVYSI
jgi:hypothetical protein